MKQQAINVLCICSKPIIEVKLCMLKRLKGQNRFYAPELLYGATENFGALRFMPVLSRKLPRKFAESVSSKGNGKSG